MTTQGSEIDKIMAKIEQARLSIANVCVLDSLELMLLKFSKVQVTFIESYSDLMYNISFTRS